VWIDFCIFLPQNIKPLIMKKTSDTLKLKILQLSIQAKFLFSIITVIVISLSALSILIYTQQKKVDDASIRSNSVQVTNLQSQALGEWLNGIQLELIQLAKRNVVKSMKWEEAGNPFKQLADSRKDVYSFLALVSLDGSYYSTIKGKEKANVSKRSLFTDIIEKKMEYAISDPEMSATTGKQSFFISIPIKDDNQVTKGILVACVLTETMKTAISKIKINNKGYGWVIDSKGTILIHPKAEYILKFNVLNSSKVGFVGLEELGKEVILKDKGIGTYLSPDKKDKILIYSKIPNSNNWSLGIVLDSEEIFEPIQNLLFNLIFITSAMLAVIILVIFLLSKYIIRRPMISLVRDIQDIAKGQLYKEIVIDSNDEIGQVKTAMREMVVKINEIVSSIRTAADAINIGSNEISSSAESISQGAAQQASSVEEISSSVEEVVASIQQNSENALLAERIASEINTNIGIISENSKQSLQKTNEALNKVEIINEIAQRTDLLALNAAVEAARAGVHGKGFAIVAMEIRKLAEKSKAATLEINEYSKKSILYTENTTKLLENILPDIRKNADLIREISAASAEQSGGAGLINDAIQQLTQIAQSNSVASEELAANSEELSSQASQLKEMVTFFKLDESEMGSVNEIFDLIEKHNAEIMQLRAKLTAFSNNTQPAKSEQNQAKPNKGHRQMLDLDLSKEEKDIDYTKY
jgi:methyl-accepting chemotaxis protein